ncbi:hypothetical protein DSO57_1006040 [Entomophthora muscae]|uniref:Uncharacterized protein n=1 Tax=Entomophthora muscae TaxID=34485 RepID=A0ACC2T841_9FUNG|nr:hypothetical protein DSO57_1006040 [Entomophthora muscae]
MTTNAVDAEEYSDQSLDQFRDQAQRAGDFDTMLEHGFPSPDNGQENIPTAKFTLTPDIAQ